jgi:mannosyltransferase
MPHPPLVSTMVEKQSGLHEGLARRKESGLWPVLPSSADEPVAWGWLAGLVIVATVLRVWSLNQQLWFDEIVTLLDSAREPVSRIVTQYAGQNQHMLYSLLAHGSIRLFGEQPWALRLPAVLFGVASVPALYFLGRLVTTSREALAASALMTVNYQHIWFSQNARGYTGMLFWTLLASIFFLRSASKGTKQDWILYAVTAALGIYTHLMMACVVAGHLALYLWMLASQVRSGHKLSRSSFLPAYGFLLSGVASMLLYAPVIPRVLANTVGIARDTQRYEWASPLWTLAELVRGLRSGTAGGLLAITIGGVLLLSGLFSYWHQNRFTAGLFIFPGLLTAGAVLATSHNFWPRFFFFEIGFAMLLLVRGAMALGRFGSRLLGDSPKLGVQMGAAVVVLMLAASVVPLRAEYLYPKQDYLGVMKFLDEQQHPGEQVVTVGAVTTPYQRYYGRKWPLVQTRSDLDSALLNGHATWLIYAMPTSIRSSEPELWEAIQSRFVLVRSFPGTLGGGAIYVAKSAAPGDMVRPVK